MMAFLNNFDVSISAKNSWWLFRKIFLLHVPGSLQMTLKMRVMQCTNIAAFFSFQGWLPRYGIIITVSCSFLLLHKLCIQFNCQRPKAAATLQKHISDYFSDIFANFHPRGVNKRVQLSPKFLTFTAVWVRNWSQVLTWYKFFYRYKKTPYGSF